MFFPGIFIATKDRKSMLEMSGNVMINVKVEPDYVYQCYSMFSEKKHPKCPAFMKYEDNCEFSYKQELLFPAYYPFKIMGVKKTDDVYEVFCTSPNVFHYNDNSIQILNRDQTDSTQGKNKKNDEDGSIDSKTKICPFKFKRESLSYEIDLYESYLSNYEKLKTKEIQINDFYQNNDIIIRARNAMKLNLIDSGKLIDHKYLFFLIQYFKNVNEEVVFDLLYICIENIQHSDVEKEEEEVEGLAQAPFERDVRELTNSKKRTLSLSYRILLASKNSEKIYSCCSTLTDIDLNTNFSIYRNFFEGLTSVTEVYLNFPACDNKFKD